MINRIKLDLTINYIIVIFIVIFLAIALHRFTPTVLGVNPDSVQYISGAKNLTTNFHYSYLNNIAITHYPPMYSIIVALLNKFISNFLLTAHLLNAILFGLYAGLIGIIVYKTTGRNRYITLISIVQLSTQFSVHFLYFWAWSEPLFIVTILVGEIYLIKHIQSDNNYFLLPSSLCFAVSALTRYIGLSFIPAAALMVFFFKRSKDLKTKFSSALIWILFASIPIGLFVLRNVLTTGTLTSRVVNYHPLPLSVFIINLINSVYKFVIPGNNSVFRMIFMGFFVSIVISPFLIFILSRPKKVRWRSIEFLVPITSFGLFLSYIIFLYASTNYFDAATPIDMRLMTPILIILFLSLFTGVWAISQQIHQPIVFHTYIFFVVISITINSIETYKSYEFISTNGLGQTSFTSQQWQKSEFIALIREGHPDAVYFSNGPDAIAFLTDINSLPIPQKVSPFSLMENENYEEEISNMCRQVRKKEASLVYFNLITWRTTTPTQEELLASCQLTDYRLMDEGLITGIISKE